jgi:3D (Asp-Asp-Asp) domain-containing protein
MWIFTQKFNLTPRKRKAILGIMAILTFTSTQVQAAEVSATTQVAPETVQDSPVPQAPVVTGLVVPVSTTTAPLPVAPVAPAKKKWNTINAADLTTQPDHSDAPAARTFMVPVTAYTSEPGQTDSTPYTTADGTQVRNGIIAANFLPIGARVRIPEYYGNQVFEVHDRMNVRYPYRMDIWMANKSSAMSWGLRNVKVEVLN